MKMNKLSIAFATVAMATMANASTVTWGITTALDTEKFNAGTIYLFAGSSVADLTSWAEKQESFTFDPCIDRTVQERSSEVIWPYSTPRQALRPTPLPFPGARVQAQATP